MNKEQFGVSQLAHEMGMSRSNLHRKVKAETNKSVSRFICDIRLKKAVKLLSENKGNVSEIAYQVGFGSVTYFSKCFHDMYGFAPGDVLSGKEKIRTSEEKKSKKRKTILLLQNLIFITVLSIAAVFFIYKIIGNKNTETHKTLAAFILQDSAKNINENSAKINMLNFELINRLEEIPGISIVPFSNIQNYPFENSSNNKIGKDLKVDYILLGKALESDAELILYFELVNTATEELLWNTSGSENWEFATTGDFINILQNLINEIVENLKIELAPEKKNKLLKQPDNFVAYEKYLEAVEIMSQPNTYKQHVKKAKALLEESIELNPISSDAHTMMAAIYLDNLFFGPSAIQSSLYRDTGKIYLDKALLLDSTNYKALTLKKGYFESIKNYEKAEEIDRLISKSFKTIKNYNYYLSEFFKYYPQEPVKVIKAFYEYIEIKPGNIQTPWAVLQTMYFIYNRMGFPKEARQYANQFYMTLRDTTIEANSYHCIILETHHGNFKAALEIAEKNKNKNNGDNVIYNWLSAYCSMRNRDYSKACSFLDNMENMRNKNILEIFSGVHGRIFTFPFGYSYIMNGQEEKGKYYLNRLIKKYETEISTNNVWAAWYYPYFEAAMVWSALGNAQHSFDYLNQLLEMNAPIYLWFIIELKSNPMFDTIRGTDEYKSILNSYEKRYNEEHKKIEQLLTERKELGKSI